MYTQSGRSMVEMLGVLAIIGVLSVGAISGYSKAMIKYKLNKHAEQMNILINAVSRNAHSFVNNKQGYLTPYFIKMGEIPTEMIKSNDNNYVYDIFGQQWQIVHEGGDIYLGSYGEDSSLSLFLTSSDSLAICQNTLTIAKENSGNISATAILTDSFEYIFGDSLCDRARNVGGKCLNGLSLDDIYTICTKYKNDEGGFFMFFGF